MPPVHIIFEQCKCLPTLSCVRGIIFKPAHKLSCVILQCIASKYFVYIQCTRPCLVPSCIIKKLWITSQFGLRTILGYKSLRCTFYFGLQAILDYRDFLECKPFWDSRHFPALLGYKPFWVIIHFRLYTIMSFKPFWVIIHYKPF